MDRSDGPSRNTLLMMFGLPILTTLIVCTSMYVGHVLTRKMDRPTQVVVQPSTPNISVTAAPPAVNVTAPPATVTLIERNEGQQHAPVPMSSVRTAPRSTAAPAASTPAPRSTPAPAPALNPAPAPASTPMKAAEPARTPATSAAPAPKSEPVANRPAASKDSDSMFAAVPTSAPARPKTTAVETPKPAPVVAPAPHTPPANPPASESPMMLTAASITPVPVIRPTPAPSPAPAPAQAPVQAAASHPELLLGRPVRESDMNIETMYKLMDKYVDAYFRKKGQDPSAEQRKWLQKWVANVEQALEDGSASSEQMYLHRVTVNKRDCFDIAKATPEKTLEACRLMFRYRDAQIPWLSAMQSALTDENLKLTLNYLNAGPQ